MLNQRERRNRTVSEIALYLELRRITDQVRQCTIKLKQVNCKILTKDFTLRQQRKKKRKYLKPPFLKKAQENRVNDNHTKGHGSCESDNPNKNPSSCCEEEYHIGSQIARPEGSKYEYEITSTGDSENEDQIAVPGGSHKEYQNASTSSSETHDQIASTGSSQNEYQNEYQIAITGGSETAICVEGENEYQIASYTGTRENEDEIAVPEGIENEYQIASHGGSETEYHIERFCCMTSSPSKNTSQNNNKVITFLFYLTMFALKGYL